MKCRKCDKKAEVRLLDEFESVIIIGFCKDCELEWSWELYYDTKNPHEEHSTAYSGG